jgi:hypothetical protein
MAKGQKTILVSALEFPTTDEAIQHTYAAGWGKAMVLGDKKLVVEEQEAHRPEAAGVEFAYLCDHNGRIVTVPVND